MWLSSSDRSTRQVCIYSLFFSQQSKLSEKTESVLQENEDLVRIQAEAKVMTLLFFSSWVTFLHPLIIEWMAVTQAFSSPNLLSPPLPFHCPLPPSAHTHK